MKDFFKFTLASTLGVILAGIVFTILGIVTMVGMVASSDTETVVKENSIFVLDLEGTLSERVKDNPFQALLGEEYQSYGLDDILSSIQKAKDNENIKGIYLQTSFLPGSYPALQSGMRRKHHSLPPSQIIRCWNTHNSDWSSCAY